MKNTRQKWAWLSRGHRWAPGVRNPLKSSVRGIVLVCCSIAISKSNFTKNQGEPPPPLKKWISCCPCEHALLNAQSSILHSLNKNQIALLLLLDYSKAFDVRDHSTLLKKLEHYGIRGIALKWFESYLSGRSQFVSLKLNGSNSSLESMVYGVPQGSILGPLLFVIYINDLPGISNLAKFILYADDANIIITGSNIQEIISKIDHLTDVLIKWVYSNGLLSS